MLVDPVVVVLTIPNLITNSVNIRDLYSFGIKVSLLVIVLALSLSYLYLF